MNKHQVHDSKIVCLGGGIGTVNLVKGLRKHTPRITIVASMADDGGSAGRLRRLYNVLPPGDIVSCIASLTESEESSQFLTYRFPGDRYGKDDELSGHKMGNLMMVAAEQITGSYAGAVEYLKKIFQVTADIYPATSHSVTLHAITIDGREVHGEETIDLGKYDEPRVLQTVYLKPENPQASKDVIDAMDVADCIVAGPGDLYSNLLPVLIVPEIAQKLKEIKTKKIYVVNVANKPFETTGYVVSDFIEAITRHLGTFPFDTIIVNTNQGETLPVQFHYEYVKIDEKLHQQESFKLVEKDLLNLEFPLYHNSIKLAEAIVEQLK